MSVRLLVGFVDSATLIVSPLKAGVDRVTVTVLPLEVALTCFSGLEFDEPTSDTVIPVMPVAGLNEPDTPPIPRVTIDPVESIALLVTVREAAPHALTVVASSSGRRFIIP